MKPRQAVNDTVTLLSGTRTDRTTRPAEASKTMEYALHAERPVRPRRGIGAGLISGVRRALAALSRRA
ncbi:MAG: hypothetical protein JNL42_23340 [Anaerolineae bacterium]|nr:hypothetical protein [Anaerolineae bacterium]